MTGVIFPSQVALLGIGAIHKEVIVSGEDKIIISNVIRLTLAADHRVSDGIAGSKFLNTFKKVLSEIYKNSLNR